MARGKGRGAVRKYHWDGIQMPRTAVVTAVSLAVLIDPTESDFIPATVVRVRGVLSFIPVADTVNECRAKMLYVELNDAGSMSGDHAAIDTDSEDIAQRILWQGQHAQPATTLRQVTHLDIDMKAKLRIDASSKKALVIIFQATTTARTDMILNARVLLQGA